MHLATHQEDKIIVLSGGGTGGHITPILAVAHELKKQDPTVKTVYIGERNGKFKELTASHEAIDASYEIWAGKFRRYHGESWLRRLFDIRTNFLNIRDLFYFGIGTIQSWFLIRKLHPSVIFLKGGFVGVPVGLAAHRHHIPFITHDSDALPGLANRLVGRWARAHAVALPADVYAYPAAKTVQVGVLVEDSFKPVTTDIKNAMRQQIEVPTNATMLLITGGSSGAHNINVAVKLIADELLSEYPSLYIVHQAGKGKAGIYGNYTHERLRVIDFMRPMYTYTGAADIVVSRASGNTIAELGTQGKAVIAVANPLLTGGHQVKNAETLQTANAALTVTETAKGTNKDELKTAIKQLLDNPEQRNQLADTLQHTTLTNAAEKLAQLLLQ